MSEHVTHMAVAEESARLALYDPDFHPEMKNCLRQFPLAVQLGSITRSGDKFILPLLEKWREDWQAGDQRSEQLAYVLGWAGHRAGDRTFKPIYRITDLAYYVRGFPGPSHASIYHDAVLFHEIYQHGQDGPFDPSMFQANLDGHPAADFIPVSRIETPMSVDLADQLARLKFFLNPDEKSDWEKYWQTIEKERQKFYVAIDRYTAACHQPDPRRVRQYILQPNFYNREDFIIALCRDLRESGQSEISLEGAVAESKHQSLYAQALALGYTFYKTCSEFFLKKITLEQAKEQFRIGQRDKEKLDYYVKLAQQSTK